MGWVAWQEVWLQGLKSLQHRDVYVFAFGGGWDDFKQKFLEQTTDETNAKNCFDARYELEGERASSILDWERRQLLKVAAEKSLTVKYITVDETVVTEPPEWYA